MTWAELIRLLQAHGFQEMRRGKGSHRQFWNQATGKVVTVAVHTRHEVGKGLESRILKEAGITKSSKPKDTR